MQQHQRMYRRYVLAAVFSLVPGAVELAAQAASPRGCSIRVQGDVDRIITLGPEQLDSLTQHQIQAAFHHQDPGTYSAVRLGEVLRLAGVQLGPRPKGAGVAQYVVARASDGYKAVYAIAELDTALTRGDVWLAIKKNGAELDRSEGPCRLLVPSDRRHARSVRQVTTLEFHQVR